MTLLLSPWQPFSQSLGWSLMDPALPISIPSDFGRQHFGDAASESESVQVSSGSGKKRMSRAGTRSVSTLSAAQLERKRANDRDAQRAIRQRTKDHIDSLEKTIHDLRMAQDATEKLLAATQRQNREVMDENAYLRSRLGEAGIAVAVAPRENPIPVQTSQFPLQANASTSQIAGASTHPDDISSTPRSTLSIATSRSSDTQQHPWQQPQSNVAQSAPANLEAASVGQAGSNITNWRSHDGLQNTVSSHEHLQESSSLNHSHMQYGSNVANHPTHWETDPQPQTHSHPDPRLPLHYGPPPPPPPPQQQQQQPQQQQHQYNLPHAVPSYTAQPTPQQSAYHTPVLPQAEFQGMTVASPANYHVPQQPALLTQPVQYPTSQAQVSPAVPNPEFAPQPVQTHTPQSMGPTYTPLQGNQPYGVHHHQQPPFRSSSGSHPHPPHYPTG